MSVKHDVITQAQLQLGMDLIENASRATRVCKTYMEDLQRRIASGLSSVLCKRPFFPCAAGILGGGKVGILRLDFHFSTAHSFSSFCCS